MKIITSCISPLNGKTFVLELSRDIRFKAKQELINYLREQNASISYILTASTDYVLVSNDIDTYKTRRAKQLGIPLVNVKYIYECRNLSIEKEAVDIKRFIVTSAEDKENFSKNGTIPTSGGGSSTTTIKPVKLDLSKIKIWNSDDVELPQFDELTHAEIGKWAIFKETNENSDVYFALELQIIPEESNNQTNNNYRLRFRYEKQTITSSKGKIALIQYAFSNDINELHQLFASYYYRIATMPRITRIRDLLPDKLGSKLLLRSLFLHRIDTQTLDDNVCQLIESLWIESIGDLNKILSIQPESIALKTIIEAEATLLEIKSNSKSSSEAETRFYSLIPHRQLFVVDLINNRRALIDKIDLCQMLRDMLTVNELTNWNIKASIEAKYRALKCHIEPLGNDTHEYTTISDMISSSTNSNEQVIIHQIYSVAKQTDALNFRSTLFNQKQLFHGSKYNNFLGILSRGLLMPKMVVNDLGITRTDIGCLGYGIYFSDSVSTSLKYTTSSTTRSGRRLLCISQVALGDSAKFYSYSSNLTQPPDNFHSTHGVKKTNENNSKFIDDEYAIYNLDQQRLLYIIELSWIPHDNIDQSFKLLPIIRDQLTNRSIIPTNEVDIPSTIEDEVIQVAEQDYGLICPSSGELVPLKAFHIRAQLVDVTAEVILYQVYHNKSSIPIEAKYVFPLEENCSVCGFEAHINNKIIKGVVKEKEQAKREYREAIEKGHGAYLMHQEQPEVFSVSVGNLPANCEVIIKITYVAELSIENNDIIFRLPAKVASWQSKQALEMKDQTILPSINLEQDNSSLKSVEFSLKTSIRMPYEILKLFSPTHRLRRKITDCMAMIELVDNILLEKDFILSITLKSVNLPRMLNETYEDGSSQACMLTFYPKFEMMTNSNDYVEIVYLIDVSNSMDGNHIQQAKQLAHLFLTNMKHDDGKIYFNIVTFGSDNDECFPISSPNTKENIDKAKHFVLHSLDHRGNTDLFSVLRQYSLLPSSSKLGRQFLLLSDGHINDLKSVLTLLENQSSMRHDRLFTCSIGDISNKHNLKQLANQANGGGLTTVFDSNYRSRWKTKVLQILEHIHQPCVTNISIDWHGTIDNQQAKFTNQAPKIIRSLFNGMRLTVYRFIQNCHKATLTAIINNQEFVINVFSNKITETKGQILHCLTARAIIQDYENGLLHNDESENELIKKQYKQDLIELSMKYSVVSSFTSFVAIEERDGQAFEPGVRLLDVILEHDIDLLPYIAWDGDRSQIDLIKEKLINAKRLLDSASISNKIDLSNEYENLCKSISYRSGGDEKYQLMLTIIETYRMILKEKDKARELEEKMEQDLVNEISNATADERKILEKQLDEIDTRFKMEEPEDSKDQTQNSGDDDEFASDLEELSYRGEGEGEGEGSDDDDELTCNMLQLRSFNSSSHDELDKSAYESKEIGSLVTGARKSKLINLDTEESEEDWDGDISPYNGACLEPAAASVSGKAKAEACLNDSKEDEGDDMGFGLFDDDEPESFLTMILKAKEKLVVQSKNNSTKLVKDMSPASPCASQAEQLSIMENLKKRLMQRRSMISNVSWSSDSSEDNLPPATKAFIPLSGNGMVDSKPVTISPHIQQQQQTVMNLASYAPTSPLNLIRKSSSLTLDGSAPVFGQSSDFLSDHVSVPVPCLIPTAATTTTTNTPLFSGFGGLASSTTVAAIPPPPPLPPSGLFSFTPSMNNVNNSNINTSLQHTGFAGPSTFSFATPASSVTNYDMNVPFTSTAFGGSAMFSRGPPPPPPLPNSTLFGSSNSSNNNIFAMHTMPPVFGNQQMSMSSPFQGSFSSVAATAGASPFSFGTTSSSQQQQSLLFDNSSTTTTANIPPPPPPPPPPRNHPGFSPSTIGFSPSYSVAPSVTTSFGGSPTYRPAPPPPPPPPFPGSVPFGSSSSSSSNNNIFKMQTIQPVYGNQQMPVPSPFQSSLSSQTTTSPSTFGFGSTLSSPQQQSSLFGSNNVSTSANVAPSTTVNQSMSTFPSPPCPPPMLLSTVSIPSTSDTALNSAISQRLKKSVTNDRSAVKEKLYSAPAREGRAHDLSERSDRGSNDNKSPALHSKGLPRQTWSAQAIEQDEALITNFQDDSAEPTMSLSQFIDTRKDEQERKVLPAPTSQLLMSDDDDDDLFSLTKQAKKNKKKKSETLATSGKVAIQDLLLLDVTPLGFGIEDVNGHMCTIISRNRTIPTRTQFYSVFTNAYAYQTTATIRVFRGEHKLTKYNTLVGEVTLSGLTPNFASQVLEISIRMGIDSNGILEVEIEESRSGAKAEIRIYEKDHPINKNELEQHVAYVASNSNFQALSVTDRQSNDSLYMLKGDTENTKISFNGETEISKDFSTFEKFKHLDMTSSIINELERIQLVDGSFDLNQDLANLLSINIKNFDALKKYLSKQGFNSLALNIQNEIIHLIATGIILIELFFQVPTSERKTFLVPFDREQIRSIFSRHLPQHLLENAHKAVDFYEQKRLRYGIYCEQLELNYSSWEKFIQHSIFDINN